MSRRTVEANRAIRLAWQRECELVQEGKGTRDWTMEQQRDILNPELGKAYDEDGKAFEGHHMKSAEAYPEYQGNPQNIQFLSRAEHTKAHGGWQKPTNGYYDYITGILHDFGEDGFEPCKIIKLSNPVIVIDTCDVDKSIKAINQAAAEELCLDSLPSLDANQQSDVVDLSIPRSSSILQGSQVPKEKVIRNIKNVLNTVKEFPDKHPILTAGLGFAVTAIAAKGIDAKIRANPSGQTGRVVLSNQAVADTLEIVTDKISKFDFKKSISVLKSLGYSVAKDTGLSDIDRQKILQAAIAAGKMSKESVCAFLKNNINLHKNQDSFAEAVSKWTADLAYVKDIP